MNRKQAQPILDRLARNDQEAHDVLLRCIKDTEGLAYVGGGTTRDAAHIVRCVNSHDALVDALRYAREQLAAYNTTKVGVHWAASEKCDAALKAATEGA